MTSEQVKAVCNAQHKMMICDILISKMPLGYTNDTINEMKRDLDIRVQKEGYEKQMKELIDEIGNAEIIKCFSDKEFMQKEENRFTFEDQRKATKEVIGKEYTLEEFIELHAPEMLNG